MGLSNSVAPRRVRGLLFEGTDYRWLCPDLRLDRRQMIHFQANGTNSQGASLIVSGFKRLLSRAARAFVISAALNSVFCTLSSMALAPEREARYSNVPDLCQTDPRAGLPGGGRQYCGPVAASDYLVWLSKNGFERLAPSYDGSLVSQANIARRLGGAGLMRVGAEGTGPSAFLRGLSTYIAKSGYSPKYLAYQGWRYHPAAYDTGVSIPNLEWIRRGLKKNSAVWLNIGWYQYDRSSSVYRRFAGHWVAVVGDERHASAGSGKNSGVLLIHDPAGRSGKAMKTEVANFLPLKKGLLVSQRGRKLDARGFLHAVSGLRLHSRADTAIIDGAVILQM